MNPSNVLPREEMVRRAVRVLLAPGGTVQMKLAYLSDKGCDGTVITEALNTASGGELVRTALRPIRKAVPR